MAVSDVKNTLQIPATLYLNPTDPDNPETTGTPLGVHEELVVTIGWTEEPIRNKLSGYHNEIICIFETVRISGLQRSFDKDMLGAVHDNLVTDTRSTVPYLRDKAGFGTRLLTSDTNNILVAPLEPEIHPGFILYNAAGRLSDNSDINHQIDERWGHIFVFDGFVDNSSGRRLWQWGLLQDMSV